MTLAEPTEVLVAPSRPPSTTVLRRTARQAARSGVLWGALFGAFVVASAWSYSSIYTTAAMRAALATAFGHNTATIALFGPAPQLETVAGFTILKTFLTLSLLGAVWGLLTSTRLLRGEEDAGRWDLLLVGATTRGRAATQALVGLLGGVAAMWVVIAAILTIAGRSSTIGFSVTASLFFALTLVASPMMFGALGALSSQLGATRRQAASWAAMVLAASYAIRMVADSGTGLHGLVWLSPLGWVEETTPLTSSDPWPLLLIAGFTLACGAAAVALATTRDAGASTLPDRDRAHPRLRLLSGQLGLSVRLLRPTSIAWAGAITVTGLLTGFVAKGAASTFSSSSLADVFKKLGAPGTGTDTYLGVIFLETAVLVAFVAASHVAAARLEEAEGRLENLVVRPVRRGAWLLGRMAVGAAVVVLCALSAGTATWVGALSQGATIPLSTTLGAGLNVVPPAICVLGIGVLAFGLVPRAASALTYGYVGWALLIEVVGGIGALNHLVADTSVFRQMAAYPAVSVNWTTSLVMLGWGALFGLVGLVAFARRDLRGA